MSEATTFDVATPARPPRRGVARRFLRNVQGTAALLVLVAIVLAVVAAPLLTHAGPNGGDIAHAFGGPAAGHPFGFDSAGRDIFARLLYGGRATLGGALLALAIAIAIGVTSGLLAGYYGGFIDQAGNWVANLLLSLPAMIVLLASRSVIGPNTWGLMVVFGVLASPSYFRVVRSIVAKVRGELYVDAARVSGLSDARIIVRHIVAVVRGPLLIQTALVAGIAIGLQAALEFLGIGGGADATWGGMLNEAFQYLGNHPRLMLWPGLALGLTSGCLVLVASALRDVLEGDVGATRRRHRARAMAAPGGTVSVVPTAQWDADRSGLLSVRDLKVAYADGENEIVHGVDLEVRPGEIVGLVGESGSGKTQSALAILGILPDGGRVTGGSVLVRDVEVLGLRGAARRAYAGSVIGYVPQEPMTNLDPSFTIGSQLTEPLRRVAGMSRRAARAAALDLLRQVDIRDPGRVLRSYPHEISGGMAQRVLIAGAVSCDPVILIADEPTTALDVTVQAEILELLRRLQRERDLGVLLVTHNLGVIADIADSVVVMQDGRVVESGPTERVLTRPQQAYTRRLLDAVLDPHGPRAATDPGVSA